MIASTSAILAAGQRVSAADDIQFTPPVAGYSLYTDARWHNALAEGAAMTQWDDLSGGAHHITPQSGGAFIPPTYDRDAFGAGLHAWKFGTNKAARLASFMAAYTAVELFALLKTDNDPPTAALSGLWQWHGSTSANFPWTDGIIYDHFSRNGFLVQGNPARALTSLNVWNVSNQAGANNYVARLNEVVMLTAAGGVTFSNPPAGGIWLGTYPTGNFFGGHFGLLLIYPFVLTAPQRAATYAWLKGQWPGLP